MHQRGSSESDRYVKGCCVSAAWFAAACVASAFLGMCIGHSCGWRGGIDAGRLIEKNFRMNAG